MAELFKTLLSITIYSSILILVVLSFKATFNKKSSVKYASFLWLIVLTRLLFFFTVDSPFHFDALMNTGNKPATVETEDTSNNQNNEFPFEYTSENNYAYNQEDAYSNSNILNKNTTVPELNVLQTNTFDFAEFIKSINIWLVLSIAWIAGVIYQVIKSTISVIRFKNQIRVNRKELSKDITGVLGECINIVGLKTKVKIYECECVNRPITYGVISPSILLPTGFHTTTSNNKMRLILLHEVCHVKRIDILKNYLWQIAKTIHWFNPLVLFACKSFQEDLELSCDGMVLNYLDRRDKFEYSQSLLDVMRLSKEYVRIPIALSFFENKSTLRKRVENVVEPKKMSARLTFTTVVLVLVLLFTCFTTACQPTPEDDVVVNKNDGNLEKIISSTPAPSVEIVPREKWEETIEKDNVRINIDASYNIPTVDSFPVIGVERIYFAEADVQKAIDVFFQDATLMKYTSRTKEFLENYILQEKQRLATIKNAPDYQQGDEDVINERIEALLEEYKTAPSENSCIIDVNDIKFTDNDGMRSIHLSADLGDAGFGRLHVVSPTSAMGVNALSFQIVMDEYYDILISELSDKTPNNVDMSLEQAIQMAESIMSELSIDDMLLTNTSLASYLTYKTEDPNARSDEEAYVLTYKKNYNNIVVSNYLSSMLVNEQEGENNSGQYSPLLEAEYIKIIINDKGIINFEWFNPTKSGEIISENVPILDIDTIKETFKKQIFYHQWYGDPNGEMAIDINEVTLTYFLQPIKNSAGEYRAIPVWDFIGVRYVNGKPKAVDNYFKNTFLTINAIDGSVINRDLGY